MRLTELFGRTLRRPPADAALVGEQLALRAGLVRPLDNGFYGYLPVGLRVMHRIEGLLRQELEGHGFREMWLPALSGDAAAGEIARLSRREVQSYRDLPQAVYQVQSVVAGWGDGGGVARPRGGPLRRRETRFLEGYTLDGDEERAAAAYERVTDGLRRLFSLCDLSPVMAEDEGGHRFLWPHRAGEQTVVRCKRCGYAADEGSASFRRSTGTDTDRTTPAATRALLATPACATIADVAAFVSVPTSRTLKAVFYVGETKGEPVFVVIRGDLKVNETKLSRLLGGERLRPATAEEIRAVGAEPGYASPVGLPVRQGREGAGVLVVGDLSVEGGGPFVAGANRPGYHYTGVVYRRDFAVTVLADIARVEAGYPCPRCGADLTVEPAVEVARCVRPTTDLTEAAKARYLDAEGREHPLWLGSFSVAVGRLLGAVLEAHHDEHGPVWPPPLAPFDVHLLTLGTGDAVRAAADSLYARLQEAGYEVVYDDRQESAGVKFADADLFGCPVRITVSKRSLRSGGVEIKYRTGTERLIVPLEEAAEIPGHAPDRPRSS